MKKHVYSFQGQSRTYWIVGLGSLLWLLLRSGANPRRLAYPCQRAALASTDPFAVDWYASEYVLRPVASWGAQDSSAARSGNFRNATRTNQNAAELVWPGGSYPYIDLLDSYEGNTPSNAEKNQMNVYVVAGGTATNYIYLPLILKNFSGK